LRLNVPHNSERTIEMLSTKEAAIHLENLRQSHEITRELTSVLTKLKAQFKPEVRTMHPARADHNGRHNPRNHKG
jgi:hypothetical protein